MMPEDQLRRLLHEAADAIPPPGRAPEQLAARLAVPVPRPRPGHVRPSAVKGLKVVAAVAAVLAVIVGVAVAGNNSNDSDSAQTAGATFSDSGASTTIASHGDGAEFNDRLAPSPQSGSGTSDAGSAVPKASPPTDGAKIVKTGSIEIEVRRGSFERAISLITTKTIGLGGYVAKSTTSESSAQPSGSLTIRVPVDSFDELEAALRGLGKVGSVTSKGTDVTAQFTDLQARLSALVATRDRLSAVLAQASTVGDILAVQDRITQVQTQIEEIQGQQKVLSDQADFSTWAVDVGEPGSAVRTRPEEPDQGLGHAWDVARRRFGDGIEGMVAWSGPIAIVAILGAMLALVGRLGWVVVRRFTM
jgi:hypothetical protein